MPIFDPIPSERRERPPHAEAAHVLSQSETAALPSCLWTLLPAQLGLAASFTQRNGNFAPSFRPFSLSTLMPESCRLSIKCRADVLLYGC